MSKFMPLGCESLKQEKKYLKLSQFKDGESKIRIVEQPICGWIDWADNKPFRYRPSNRPKTSFNPEKPMKPFWACHIWDYSREGLYILDITQNGVIKALMAFGNDEDWGDFTQYDLKISKEGTGKETRYGVTPLPHKGISDAVLQAVMETPVRLEALYEGKDPWQDAAMGDDRPGSSRTATDLYKSA